MSDTRDGDAPEDAGGDEPEIEVEVSAEDPYAGDRLMLEACWSVCSTRYDEPFANEGVQIAYERMMIAAMGRIARICRNDLPTDEP